MEEHGGLSGCPTHPKVIQGVEVIEVASQLLELYVYHY